MGKNKIAVSISGSGGSGAVKAGQILLHSVANMGFYGYMTRFSGPQIRGGESAVVLHFADHERQETPAGSDLHFALDWKGFERFADEIPFDAKTEILYDSAHETLPQIVKESGAQTTDIPLHETLRQHKGSRANALAVGIIAAILGVSPDAILKALRQVFSAKAEDLVQSNYDTVLLGYQMSERRGDLLQKWKPVRATRWNISGNEACALGALRGGIAFAAAYPITPATDITEYLAPRLEKMGGSVVIAEDELAAMNMIIGASFGGKASMTATSGPGFSLMSEAMGLAVASETPALVINVTRGGPSTGIPTKSEQTDLNQALFGMHGEAPHVVVAPLDVGDCVVTTQWAVGLAEAMQTLVVLLSDQRLGQSRAIINAVQKRDFALKRKVWEGESATGSYERYALTKDYVSPMAIPGTPAGQYTADGLEHDTFAIPSPLAKDHKTQLKKRAQKIMRFAYGDMWAESLHCDDDAGVIVLTWGSSYMHVRLAVTELADEGLRVALLAPRLLMPLQAEAIAKACAGKKVIVVEQSYSGQFYHYCLRENAITPAALLLAQPGPLVLKTEEIKAFIKKALA